MLGAYVVAMLDDLGLGGHFPDDGGVTEKSAIGAELAREDRHHAGEASTTRIATTIRTIELVVMIGASNS